MEKMEKDIYQPLFIAFTMGVQKGQNAGGGRLSSFNSWPHQTLALRVAKDANFVDFAQFESIRRYKKKEIVHVYVEKNPVSNGQVGLFFSDLLYHFLSINLCGYPSLVRAISPFSTVPCDVIADFIEKMWQHLFSYHLLLENEK